MPKKKGSDDEEPASKRPRPSASIIGISRAISACQRCRSKKVRCDQNFPKCYRCAKAGVECIGLDPATGREVPRSYIIHLEDRISVLEQKLKENGIDPSNLDDKFNQYRDDKSGERTAESQDHAFAAEMSHSSSSHGVPVKFDDSPSPLKEQKHQNDILDEVKFNTVNHKSNRSVSTTSSISFAKLMSTAFKFQGKNTKSTSTPEIDPTTNDKEDYIQPALLPPKKTAQEFLKIHFSQSNSQLPILHREEFIRDYFLPIYGKLDSDISLASNYTAINTSMFSDSPYYHDESLTWFAQYKDEYNKRLRDLKRSKSPIDPIKISNEIAPPKKFHTALFFLNILFAISSSTHFLQYPSTVPDSFRIAALKYNDQVYKSADQLQSLQGILLLALFSIMRPALPGCWYVVGSALRLCIDLGLHNESITQKNPYDAFTKDKRRRLFWCTYAIDRQICFYLNRPVGIPDEAISTPFPTLIDDALIVPNDTTNLDYLTSNSKMSTYKSVSISMFKIRKIQSEVQKMLFQNCELPRCYKTLSEWKRAMQSELKNWKNSSPKTKRKMNCDFNLDFFALNYNHTILILHGLSPKNLKLSEDDFSQVNEAAKELITVYSSLLANKNINYTWAAILNLFMAGTSYLYSIYNCEALRNHNSLYEVKKITQECITVLNSLKDKSDTAVSCRDTFEVLTAAVVQLKYHENIQGNLKIPSTLQISKTQPAGHINPNLENLVENLESQHFTPKQEAGSEYYQTYSIKLESELNPFQTLDEDFVPSMNMSMMNTPQEQSTYRNEGYERPLISSYLPNNVGQEFNGFQSASTFEWISANPNEASGPVPYDQPGELQHFFSELERSPISTNSRRNSVGEGDMRTSYSQKSQLSQNNSTPFSYDSHDSEASPPVNFHNRVRSSNHGTHAHAFNIGANGVSGSPMGPQPVAPAHEPTVLNKDGRKVYEMLHTIPVESLWDQFFTPSSHGVYSGLNLDDNQND